MPVGSPEASPRRPASPLPGPLAGEVALITGASAGIGAATARALVRLGASVVLGARRRDRLNALRDDLLLETPGARVHVGALDVTVRDPADPLSLERFLDGAAAFGPCSILVNNAGLAKGRAAIHEANLADWDVVLDTNVRAAFAVTRAVLPSMLARGRGDIVMLASIAGVEPYANGSVYCASKAALQAFARALRGEVLGKDIRVLTFDPGMVETEFALVRTGGDVEKAKATYQGMQPVTADDVAECIAFALTRPRHVCLDRMQIMATDQLGTQAVHRRPG